MPAPLPSEAVSTSAGSSLAVASVTCFDGSSIIFQASRRKWHVLAVLSNTEASKDEGLIKTGFIWLFFFSKS